MTNDNKNTTPFNAAAFSENVSRMLDQGGKAMAAWMQPRDPALGQAEGAETSEIVKTMTAVLEYWLSDPQRALLLQQKLGSAYLELWGQAARRMAGEAAAPVVAPDARDKRFKDPDWSDNPFFDFLKQAYLLTTNWATDLVQNAEGLDQHTRHKAEFYVRQIANALAPSNFLLTNPEVLRETLATNGVNLVRGMTMLAEDVEAGRGTLRIRQTDMERLAVGRDLAVTPGKVVYQNELIQLIQYSPTTPNVLRTPLLIVPPWINKYYILDLNPQKSFIKWAVDQGVTVFVISWVNPDQTLSGKTFDDYMKFGPLAAMDAIEKATGEMKVHTLGYCVGGTLLASTLAWLAAKRRVRMASATFLATQVDFAHAGDLMVFVDEEQVSALERTMEQTGYLEGSKMATAFNLLRSNELIWPYVINNYMKGQPPAAFDLLYWNSDATRMTPANHSFYLRNCYLENRLSQGKMSIDNTKLDLGKVTVPIYNLATREDHIAPAKSVFSGAKFFGGPVRFVLSGSGHIAGVINPPAVEKYQYWTNDRAAATYDEWLAGADETKGSWWPDWMQWLKNHDSEEVPARPAGTGALATIEDAPGSYVKVRA